MEINEPNKQYDAPMHTAEHILNSRMVNYFHCDRSFSAHIEKKKSKCDYHFSSAPTEQEMATIEQQVNDIIRQNIDIEELYLPIRDVPPTIDLSKLPDPDVDTVRLIKIGTYDLCPCIGQHVANTSEIGEFKIISTDFTENKLRIRYKLQ